MKIIFDKSFWSKLRVYRIWRGYGAVFFLELEKSSEDITDPLFGGIWGDCCRAYIYRNEEMIFDYDIDGPYLDSKLLPMCGLKILDGIVKENNSLELYLENDYSVVFKLNPDEDSDPEFRRNWILHLYTDPQLYISFHTDNVTYQLYDIRANDYSHIKEPIDESRYVDQTKESYQKMRKINEEENKYFAKGLLPPKKRLNPIVSLDKSEKV